MLDGAEHLQRHRRRALRHDEVAQVEEEGHQRGEQHLLDAANSHFCKVLARGVVQRGV